MANAGIFDKMKFAPYRYVEFPKVVRDAEGHELGTAVDADEEAELLAKGWANKPAVDLERDDITQDTETGVWFVNGIAATKDQIVYIQAARAGAKAAAKLAGPVAAPPNQPTQHPDGAPIKRGPGRPTNAELAARATAGQPGQVP